MGFFIAVFYRHGEPELNENSLLREGSRFYAQKKEAAVLIPEALSALGEWQSVLDLLEDASQLVVGAESNTHLYTSPRFFHLEDDDDMARVVVAKPPLLLLSSPW